jgi:DNA topoisomerase-1
VKALEEKGIGRPSTYAPTLEILKRRGYVRTEQKRLVPTPLGRLVNQLLTTHFPNVVDVEFTARLESSLDRIEEGKADWVGVVRAFYEPFEQDLRRAEQLIEEVELRPEPTGESCPQCGAPLVRKQGRFGEFIACSRYPACTYTRPVGIGVRCPRCGGEIVERRSRRGRLFYGCVNYPACTFTSWDRPQDVRCPACGYPMAEKRTRWGEVGLRCLNPECATVAPSRAQEAAMAHP